MNVIGSRSVSEVSVDIYACTCKLYMYVSASFQKTLHVYACRFPLLLLSTPGCTSPERMCLNVDFLI